MNERDPKIVKSGLSRTVKKDGVTVEVSIIRLEHETEWSLEVVNATATTARPSSSISLNRPAFGSTAGWWRFGSTRSPQATARKRWFAIVVSKRENSMRRTAIS